MKGESAWVAISLLWFLFLFEFCWCQPCLYVSSENSHLYVTRLKSKKELNTTTTNSTVGTVIKNIGNVGLDPSGIDVDERTGLVYVAVVSGLEIYDAGNSMTHQFGS